MMKKFNKILSLLMAFAMVLTMLPASALAEEIGAESNGITVERLDPSKVTANLFKPGETIEENSAEDYYADTDVVRVMIVLEEDPAIELMHGVNDALSDGSEVAEQREHLIQVQHTVTDAISAAIGSKLDVQWNLTLVTNAISANVEFGKIDEIAAVAGVKDVYLEVRYMPLKADTSNIVSQQMTGANTVQNTGYTGAGSRVAIIDTGTDTDHQSFSGAAYEYALAELAEKNGMSFDEYVASLNLLTVEEIASVLDQLHIYTRHEGVLSAEDLYISSKLPYNYNYVDLNLSIDHSDNDNEHGSHVAGISTANRYIDCTKVYDFDGNGSFDRNDAQVLMNFVLGGKTIANVDYADLSGNGSVSTYDAHLLVDVLKQYEKNGEYFVSAYDTVRVTGVAPDAQLLTMKVFGANGGAHASDYMAAVEDAIVLGCDVVNLSLGAPYPGFKYSYASEWSAFTNDIMERVADSGIVMSVAAGNSGNWATYSENGMGMMYTDEAGTYTTGEPATYENALSVASADNITSATALQTAFKGAFGENVTVSPYSAVLDENYTLSSWADMDTIDPEFDPTIYEVVFLGDPTNLFSGLPQTDETIYAGSMNDFAGYDFTGKVVMVARGTYTFTDKHTYAGLAGAAGVIIYNNVPGAIQPNITDTKFPEIPCMGISYEEALALFSVSRRNAQGQFACYLEVCKRLELDTDVQAQYTTMSSFSSWGTTGDLRIKPEITAPGGGIYSVSGLGTSGSNYTLMSGTSMAAPHLSGLTALLSQYFKENGILEKTGMSSRVLAQSILMSTAKPIIEETTGYEYSIRNQGAGLANIQNAINSNAYILVKGQDDGKVKAELGEGTADRVVEFTITNFGDKALTYVLSASTLTTGTAMDMYGFTYSTDGMTALDANVTFSDDVVTVAPGETVAVKATISVPKSTVSYMKEIGYVNGFYLEGYLYIDPIADDEGVMDASHSIPMLGWYGSWSEPSMFDSNTFMDFAYGTLSRYSHMMYPTKNILAWCPIGYGQGLYYTGNIYGGYDAETGVVYGDQRYIEARNAISTLPTAQWEIYAIFPTLIRNAGDFKLTVTDSKTGELYYVDDYEQFDDVMYGSFYYTNYGQWYDSTGDYGIGLGDWGFTDLNGDPLPDGTQIDINLICVPELYVENGKVDWNTYKVTEGNVLTYSFTIDNTIPELVGDSLTYDEKTQTLSFNVKDNNYIASVVLLNGSATAALDYYYPDMDEDARGTAVRGSLSLADYSGTKVAIAVCDYAGNESYYAINLGGEGASYGDLMGFQIDYDGYLGSWVAFNDNVNKNETALFNGPVDFICAEYVNGYIYAQDKTGKLYGITYEDMLADSVNLEACYITTLEFVYQDLAYSYKDGKLYGISTYQDRDGYPYTEINSINLIGEYYDPNQSMTVAAYQEDWVASRGGLNALGFACSDDTFYILGTVWDGDTEELGKTAHLWSLPMEYNEYTETWAPAYMMTNLGDTGIKMDYLQSMTWDHNSETLYWARFYPVSIIDIRSELVTFIFNEDGTPVTDKDGIVATKTLGELSSETCALMAPLSAASAAKEEHLNVPTFDVEVIAKPTLNAHSLSMGKGTTSTLGAIFDPWYSEHKDLIWTSSDESVAVVDQNGVVTAVGDGVCEIIVANAEDETLFDTCDITVASMTLNIEGIISYTSGGINSVGNSRLYNYAMNEGVSELTFGDVITAPEEYMGYGLSIGAAIHAKGSIWACEFGNSGLIYEIDPMNGMIKDMLMPVDGDMMFGFSYSEATGMFTGIMNFYLYADQPLTHEAEEEMMDHMNAGYGLTWHKFDLSEYLRMSDEGFATGETGQGSIVDVVLCAITDIDNTEGVIYSDVSSDAFGSKMNATYKPTTTHVILDNVGRLWYIDEITNMSYSYNEEWGQATYRASNGSVISYGDLWGTPAVFSTVYKVDEDTELHNVFVIRDIEETPLTDMYRAGTMPRITYHFSDIYYAGKTAEGAPVFYMSLYDYWHEGSENLLYLYVGGIGTGMYDYDENWNMVEIKTEAMLFDLGGTGTGNIIASIFNATPADEIGGLPSVKYPSEEPEAAALYVNVKTERLVGFFSFEEPVDVPAAPAAPSISLSPASTAAFINRLG